MPSENLTQDLIPEMMGAGEKGAGNGPAVLMSGAADLHANADVAVPAQQLAEGVRQNAAGAAAAASRSAASWSDARPLSEQLVAYPATFFLAATFVVVSGVVLGGTVRCGACVVLARLAAAASPALMKRKLQRSAQFLSLHEVKPSTHSAQHATSTYCSLLLCVLYVCASCEYLVLMHCFLSSESSCIENKPFSQGAGTVFCGWVLLQWNTLHVNAVYQYTYRYLVLVPGTEIHTYLQLPAASS